MLEIFLPPDNKDGDSKKLVVTGLLELTEFTAFAPELEVDKNKFGGELLLALLDDAVAWDCNEVGELDLILLLSEAIGSK